MLGGNNPQLQLKEFYIKWLKQKKGTDTKYFANSMLHYLEKTKNNGFNLLIHAMLLSYDEGLFDPAKSIELINRASDLIFNKHIDNEYLNELKYFLKTIEGFFYLKGSNIDQSNKMFYEALDLKHTGITAKFHLALTEIELENLPLGISLVDEIYNTDIARLNFAIQNNSFSIYEFFLNHSITKYFFLEPKYFPVLHFFEDKLELFKSHNKASFNAVKSSLFNLQEIKVANYFTERIQANLKFIEIYVKKYTGNESLLLSDSSQEVVKKFDEIIEIISEQIKQKYSEGLNERLKIFDNKIEEIKTEKTHLENELESYHRRMNEKLKMRIVDFESQMDATINALENQVNNIDERNDLDPTVVFKNAFTYTSMLSVLVLLLAGFASYTNSEFKEMANFSNVVKTVIVEGAQWSLITFLVGTIISIFTTISTILHKSSYKQNMVRKVKNYIDEKEKGKIELRKETEFTIKQFEQKTKSRIQVFETEIADYLEKRQIEAERLQNEANGKIQLELQKLHGFYK